MSDCDQSLQTVLRLLGQSAAPWTKRSFMREMFSGRFRWDWISAFPAQAATDRARGDLFLQKLEAFLIEKIHPDRIDYEYRLPENIRELLLDAGLLTLTLDEASGGAALSFRNLTRLLEMTGSWCQTLGLALAVHNCISTSVFIPNMADGPARQHVLDQLRKGALSGLAATESHGASNIVYCATGKPTEDGKAYILDGEKVFIGNGPVGNYFVTPVSTTNANGQVEVTCFLVDASWEGFSRGPSQSYMGMHGLFNGVVRLDQVRVPVEYMLGKPGEGLLLIVQLVGAGKIFIPSLCLGALKQCLRWVKAFSTAEYMEQALSTYELTANLEARIAADIYAQEAFLIWTTLAMDSGSFDTRIELGITKTSGSDAAWHALDSTLQLIAGRGYERAESLARRKLPAYPVERFFRDLRVHRIFGTTNELVRIATGQNALAPAPAQGEVPTEFTAQYLSDANRAYLTDIAKAAARLAAAAQTALNQYGANIGNQQTLLYSFGLIGERLCTMALTLARAEADLATSATTQSALINDLAGRYCAESLSIIERAFAQGAEPDDGTAQRIRDAVTSGAADWLLHGVIPRDPEPYHTQSAGA